MSLFLFLLHKITMYQKIQSKQQNCGENQQCSYMSVSWIGKLSLVNQHLSRHRD